MPDGKRSTLPPPPGQSQAQQSEVWDEHSRVPLSQAALAVLEQAWQYTAGVGLVFPSPTGRPLSDGTLSKLCRENNVGCVPHGMRSSFFDWCAETGVPNRVAEQALAHTPRGLRATGIRTDYARKQDEMVMEMWAIYLTGTTSLN